MGVKKLVGKLPKRQDPPICSIEFDGESLEFARPRVGDLMPSREELESITRNALGVSPDHAYMCYLLGRSYVPAPEEGKVNAALLFAEIAVNNDLLFSDLWARWAERFPEFSDWFAARVQAKNDSRAEGDSGTELSTSPPDSGTNLPTSPTLD